MMLWAVELQQVRHACMPPRRPPTSHLTPAQATRLWDALPDAKWRVRVLATLVVLADTAGMLVACAQIWLVQGNACVALAFAESGLPDAALDPGVFKLQWTYPVIIAMTGVSALVAHAVLLRRLWILYAHGSLRDAFRTLMRAQIPKSPRRAPARRGFYSRRACPIEGGLCPSDAWLARGRRRDLGRHLPLPASHAGQPLRCARRVGSGVVVG
jgi:hypothetical protein